ncbi:MAG: molecular chaperone HtpG [Bdellovibrionales bacterium]
MSETRIPFRAEVSRLLEIVVHSLYSEKEIFLRELISNASDACDKLRYEALTQPELIDDDSGFRIDIALDKKARTLTVSDNGLGMTRDEMVENLGTIARSGTGAFLDRLAESVAAGSEAKKDDASRGLSLIGQFGVGFYAAFMVAQMVEVKSRKAGTDETWCWRSDGKGEFAVEEEDNRAARGTDVIVYLRQGEDEFLDVDRARTIIGKYSDHIAIPIHLDGEDKPANRASALWMRSKAEATPDQYKEFYHHVAHAFDEAALTIHWKAEGRLEYAGLLFVPGAKPYDLFDPQRRHGVKLYVRRVFITDHAEGLVPSWLRFLRGVVDSEDLPLNVSREMLQNNPMISHIRRGVTRKVLGELGKLMADEKAYAAFWGNFGAVMKEGLYEDADNREELLKLLRCASSAESAFGALVSLDAYVGRMKEGQEAIYYICGESAEKLSRSPHLEGFRAKGVEVLLLTDTVDDFWPAAVGTYDGKSFKSITRASAELDKIRGAAGEGDKAADKKDEESKVAAGDMASLVALVKLTLGEEVKDVRVSARLTESPVCLAADEGDLDIHLERFLKQHNQVRVPIKRILEMNSKHPLIARLAERAKAKGASETLQDVVWLLLDQARLADGEAPPDTAAFARRLGEALLKVV